ncbi:HAMP domain-containing histidine kinase [Pedobacter sp. KBS0701]|uniref:GAF domain-containing sensor histidine kinase n=1 Tax=Pedobacter sp. KBS0701 TaxID=2578106 RepID=UPI00110DDAA3|nr:HAMP domain-containing sensor histidine kinase [Pedobacter sp. KBS0701]QDW24430.1 HAMP domain-containing histidine kinase [Pedobacter sp. KBS0701]
MNNTPNLPDTEQQRLQALDSYQIMDSLPEEDFDELTKMASQICGTPIALITLVDSSRQWFKSKLGIDVQQTPREHAFCAYTITDPSGILMVSNAREDQRFAENPLVTGDPNIAFYAGISLQTSEGMQLGSLCVIDTIPRTLDEQQLWSLKVLGKQVIAQMELRKKLLLLSEANRRLAETNQFMQQFATAAAHDIKNPLTTISMSTELLTRHLNHSGDHKGHKLALTSLNSAKTLAKLINDMLDYSIRPEILTAQHESIELGSFLRRTVSMLSIPENVQISYPEAKIEINTSAIALHQIMINLLTNSVRYNDKQTCLIQIDCVIKDDLVNITVCDNGMGIRKEELERIFQRNVTLNTSDRFAQSGTGIGLATVKLLVEKLGGQISVQSTPGTGSAFTFTISSKKTSIKNNSKIVLQ